MSNKLQPVVLEGLVLQEQVDVHGIDAQPELGQLVIHHIEPIDHSGWLWEGPFRYDSLGQCLDQLCIHKGSIGLDRFVAVNWTGDGLLPYRCEPTLPAPTALVSMRLTTSRFCL